EGALRAAKEQSGVDQQNEAGRYLAGDQDSAQSGTIKTLPESSAVFFKGRVNVSLGGFEGRSEAKGNSSCAGDKQGVGEDADVGRDLKSNGAPERRESCSDLHVQEEEQSNAGHGGSDDGPRLRIKFREVISTGDNVHTHVALSFGILRSQLGRENIEFGLRIGERNALFQSTTGKAGNHQAIFEFLAGRCSQRDFCGEGRPKIGNR